MNILERVIAADPKFAETAKRMKYRAVVELSSVDVYAADGTLVQRCGADELFHDSALIDVVPNLTRFDFDMLLHDLEHSGEHKRSDGMTIKLAVVAFDHNELDAQYVTVS